MRYLHLHFLLSVKFFFFYWKKKRMVNSNLLIVSQCKKSLFIRGYVIEVWQKKLRIESTVAATNNLKRDRQIGLAWHSRSGVTQQILCLLPAKSHLNHNFVTYNSNTRACRTHNFKSWDFLTLFLHNHIFSSTVTLHVIYSHQQTRWNLIPWWKLFKYIVNLNLTLPFRFFFFLVFLLIFLWNNGRSV